MRLPGHAERARERAGVLRRRGTDDKCDGDRHCGVGGESNASRPRLASGHAESACLDTPGSSTYSRRGAKPGGAGEVRRSSPPPGGRGGLVFSLPRFAANNLRRRANM